MNILTLNYEYPPVGGGGGVAHRLIAEELAKRHRVAVVTSAFRDLPDHEVAGGVEVHRVPVLARGQRSAASMSSLLTYPVSAWWKAGRLLREESFDVVNSHFAVPTGAAGVPAAAFAGLPHVLSIHGGDIYDPSKRTSPHRLPLVRATVAAVMRRSDAVVAQSADTRGNAYRYYRYDGPIEVIPLGIRVPEVPTATREALDLPVGSPLAITVGRLVRRKGLDRLIRLMQDPALGDLRLVVVGSGPELESLRALASRFGISGRVRFAGWVSEKKKWQLLRAADFFISTSMHEGFGLAYIEAMAAGLPVVAPDHGGQVDFLEDGVTGYVTRAPDDGAVIRAIRRLLDRPAERAEMGRTSAARSETFRIERCARGYEQLFERLAGEDRAQGSAVTPEEDVVGGAPG